MKIYQSMVFQLENDRFFNVFIFARPLMVFDQNRGSMTFFHFAIRQMVFSPFDSLRTVNIEKPLDFWQK